MLMMKIIHCSSSKISAHTNFDLLSTEYYSRSALGMGGPYVFKRRKSSDNDF